MSILPVFSSPDLANVSSTPIHDETGSLEGMHNLSFSQLFDFFLLPVALNRCVLYIFLGVASNVMVLLKLIQEQNKASIDGNNGRSAQRVAGMLSILDDVKTRIEKAQSSLGRKKVAEFRRCNTELTRSNIPPQGDKSPDAAGDEKARLKKELMASVAAKRNLEVMCSSLGKEKEIMAMELSRKAGEVQGLEELINDLKAQNASLLAKVQTCAAEHKDQKGVNGQKVPEATGSNAAALQERNRTLSEQLLKALDGYRTQKRKLRDLQAQNAELRKTIENVGIDITAGLERIREYQQKMAVVGKIPTVAKNEISAIENMFEGLQRKVSKHGHKKSECGKTKSDINTSNPTSVLA